MRMHDVHTQDVHTQGVVRLLEAERSHGATEAGDNWVCARVCATMVCVVVACVCVCVFGLIAVRHE